MSKKHTRQNIQNHRQTEKLLVFFKPSVSIPEGGLKNWWKWLKGYDVNPCSQGPFIIIIIIIIICPPAQSRGREN